ncbi:MAG: glycosyltransferase family 39 protein [Bryobacteraceae bacterium]
MSSRRFYLAVAALQALMATLQVSSIVLESQTVDEAVHLTAGVAIWKTGDYRLDREHPPLLPLIAAIPPLIAGVDFKADPAHWESANDFPIAWPFLYQNRLAPDTILLLARLPAIALTLALGLVLAVYARRRFGDAPALVALFFFVTDANLIAHGRYVTTDAVATFGIFLAAISWIAALDSERWRDWMLAGAALGIALVAKFSTLFLLPVHVAVAIAKRRSSLGRPMGAFAAAAAVVAVVYLPDTLRLPSAPPLASSVQAVSPRAQAMQAAAAKWHVPKHGYLHGVYELLAHDDFGHPTYLNGVRSAKGSWLYFPTAFAVKTPTATLALSLAAIVLAWRRFSLLAIYPIVYALLAVSSSINLGIRHLLPVYPFLFLLIGIVFARKRWVLAVAVAVQLFELARIHPNYLSFFNTLAGGPAAGHRYLLDSNIDWGQDGKKLAVWMRQHRVNAMCVDYFGPAPLPIYGVGMLPLAKNEAERAELDCQYAVSLTRLFDVYDPPQTHEWLRKLEPVDRVGYSIWIYDLRKRSGGSILK